MAFPCIHLSDRIHILKWHRSPSMNCSSLCLQLHLLLFCTHPITHTRTPICIAPVQLEFLRVSKHTKLFLPSIPFLRLFPLSGMPSPHSQHLHLYVAIPTQSLRLNIGRFFFWKDSPALTFQSWLRYLLRVPSKLPAAYLPTQTRKWGALSGLSHRCLVVPGTYYMLIWALIYLPNKCLLST